VKKKNIFYNKLFKRRYTFYIREEPLGLGATPESHPLNPQKGSVCPEMAIN